MPKIYPKEVKQETRNLRNQGWTLGEISLKMKVPKNTLSGWVKDIKLAEKQKERIRQKIISSSAIGRPLAVKANREKVEQWKERIRERVKHLGTYALNDPEAGKLICGLLYLCEGAKYPSSRFLHFGNSDSKVINFFINLLRKSYPIDEDKLRFSIGYRYDQDCEELKNYWSSVIRVPKSKCLNSKPDTRTKGKPTRKENYKGICRIIYYDTSLQFELQSIGETIIKGRL
jgi:hypothetical protein